MVALATPRLLLVPTPLAVLKRRQRCDDFSADVSVSLDEAGGTVTRVIRVRFPPEWPGDALVLVPLWESLMEADPNYDMMGGTVIDRAEHVAVGQMTFRQVPENPSILELGYGINPEYAGRGYATEMARRLVCWALEQPGVATITAACLETNIASIRVLEKVGFRCVGRREDEEGLMFLWQYGEP